MTIPRKIYTQNKNKKAKKRNILIRQNLKEDQSLNVQGKDAFVQNFAQFYTKIHFAVSSEPFASLRRFRVISSTTQIFS